MNLINTSLFYLPPNDEMVFKLFPPVEQFTKEILDLYRLICERGGIVISYEVECPDAIVIIDEDLVENLMRDSEEIMRLDPPTTSYVKKFIYDSIEKDELMALDDYKFNLDPSVFRQGTQERNENEGRMEEDTNTSTTSTKMSTRSQSSARKGENNQIQVDKHNTPSSPDIIKESQIIIDKSFSSIEGTPPPQTTSAAANLKATSTVTNKDNQKKKTTSKLIYDESESDSSDESSSSNNASSSDSEPEQNGINALNGNATNPPFTRDEDLLILKTINEKNWHELLEKRNIYKTMEQDKLITNRPWHSLFSRCTNTIIPNIESYGLSEDTLNKFKKHIYCFSKTFTGENEKTLPKSTATITSIATTATSIPIPSTSAASTIKKKKASTLAQSKDRQVVSLSDSEEVEDDIFNVTAEGKVDNGKEKSKNKRKNKRHEYGKRVKTRHPYTRKEDLLIIEIIDENKWHNYWGGNTIYKKIEESKIFPYHTWQSLANRFKKYIFPNLRDYNIDKKVEKKFYLSISAIKDGKRVQIPDSKLNKMKKRPPPPDSSQSSH